ncbi:MAG: hypothetical protein EBV86_03910 [Marivivens sp.]|nr:hypothetical protein [Marivivens sp.]
MAIGTKKTTRKRARTKDGHFIADDPKTPENEAWVEEAPKAKPAPKKEAPKKAEPEFVIFESREQEPSMFSVAGVNSTRNFSTGRLEFKVKADDVERFEKNHFVMNARVVRKAV